MANETIEKIAKVINKTCTKFEMFNPKWCAEAIYTEIVEPLEKELKKFDENVLRQIIEKNCILNEENMELEHKAEVLERALKLCIEDCLDDATPFMGNIEYYIQQAQKELENE